MEWQPTEDTLLQLSGFLKDSLNGANPNAQRHATEILKLAEGSPDINNYLTYLLIKGDPLPGFSLPEWLMVRQAASLRLKNHIKQSLNHIPVSNLEYLKSKVLLGLQDPHSQIRGVTGNVITELVRQGGILSWTDLLTRLIAIVEGDPSLGDVSVPTKEGAMSALAKVCEDNKKSLDRDYNGHRPLNFLVPKFLQFTSSPVAKIRAYSLGCINIFLQNKTQSVLVHIDTLITAIFNLASDPSHAVRREVCRAIVHLVDIRPDKLAPHLGGIVEYMISQQLKTDEADLSLDAAEFWLTAGEHDQLKMGLGPYLDKIIPTLLKSMVYSDEDIARLAGAGDDADVEDRAEDIKPVFAKSKHRLPNGESVDAAEAAVNGAKTPGEIALDELSDGEIDEMSDGEGDDDPEDRWNLRKCSAAALDVLASVYHQPIFEIILPYLKENIRSDQWPYREAAVLALGAVADGCLEAVVPHLPELIPYLLTLLNDSEPLVRQITCWTLGRYSRWAANLPDESLQQRYFVPMMEGLLTKMLDGNKRVQEAGASAFANLEEQSQSALTPFIEPILKQFVVAMERYKDRNMFILYDCIQTLAEHVGGALAEQKYVNILMPALIKRWEKVKDNSRELFPLLECLSYVATALSHEFAPFAGPIFFRCVRIIHHNLEMYIQAAQAANKNEVAEWPDKDFLVTSLDLLSAVVQALDASSAELVANAQPGFFDLLIVCMGDPNNDVRQSSYALLGDCAIYVFPQLQGYLPQIMGLLIEQLDMSNAEQDYDLGGDVMDTGYSVINNACWSCGEIALKQGPGMAPYVERLYSRLLTIVQTPDIPGSVTENAAIALGRLGLGSCDDLAPHLESFARPFLDAIRNVAETDEKDTALRGFAMIVGRNPEAMESCLVPFFKCIARYKEPSAELRDLFQQTLTGYQSFIADFEAFMNQIPPDLRKELQSFYRL